MAEPDAAAQAGPAVGTRLSVAEIHDNVLHAADEELRRPFAELAWSSLDAGLTIGFSFVAGAYASTLVPAAYGPAISAAAYPLGFIFVVLARSQLFTENTLEPLIPLLNRRNRRTLMQVLRLWAIVLPGNLLGALLFALVLAHTAMFEDALKTALGRVAEHGTDGGAILVGMRAIFAGWLVGLMAWLVASTRATGAQIVLIWLTTAPIAAFGLRHSIAGSVEAFYRATSGAASWGTMLGGFLVPAIVGNVIGGVILVALLNYGQVSPHGSSQRKTFGHGRRRR